MSSGQKSQRTLPSSEFNAPTSISACSEVLDSSSTINDPSAPDPISVFKKALVGNWDTLVGPRTVSNPANTKSKFHAYIYSKKLMIRDKQEDGERHTVRCCHCRKIWVNRSPVETTTSLYIRHIGDEHRDLPSKQSLYDAKLSELQLLSRSVKRLRSSQDIRTPWTQAEAAQRARKPGEVFDNDQYRELLVSFLVETDSAFRLVEAKSFRRLVQCCNSNCPLISRRTVMEDLQKMHHNLQQSVRSKLEQHIKSGGRISITLDAWTAGNKLPYLGITAHWIDEEFKLWDIVLDFIRLHGSHTAENLAGVVENTLQQYGILDFLGCITADNASVNGKMMDILDRVI
ncbi:uncharacterized protein H6S33_007073 [Morchella sextelata]|uniref:uncharacterized protein n=1 Tax=Morchella sextelata TaxID=1174677 RepID=UPI001D036DFD|nr:uncharacterized protein H6S33_007073 [Morchella sextelata]KAH0604042.1 hypothetical protein H6S33_007073 [Morchella sextelata]